MTKDDRDKLERALLRLVETERKTASGLCGATSRMLPSLSAGDDLWWRKVDGALQRLRRRGLIESKRYGGFAYWCRTEMQP